MPRLFSGFQMKGDKLCVRILMILKKMMIKNNEKWSLQNVEIPVEMGNSENTPLLFKVFNDTLEKMHQRRSLLLPNFGDSETVLIFSDYGGESHDSKYLTYTFLFVDYDTVGCYFYPLMKEIRKKYFIEVPDKEIAFKDFSYGPIKRCLSEYLSWANNLINGLVFTLVVSKEVLSLIGGDTRKKQKEYLDFLEQNQLGKWKYSTLEKTGRIILPIAYFSKLLIPNNKKIFWMTDKDSIMPNESKEKIVTQFISNTLNALKNPPKYEVCGYSAQPFAEDICSFKDVLSIADIVAGSIEHYLTNKDKSEIMPRIFKLKQKRIRFCSGLVYKGLV